ncbi:MAG: hypothetical protein V3R49_00965 [Gammaproteobacteria bacterium]
MSEQEALNAIRRIKNTHENLVVTIGVLIGMTLLVYFFTFAMFVDKASTGLIWFEIITAILMALVLVFLKKVGLFLTKILLGRRSDCRTVLGMLVAADLALDEQVLVEKIEKK